MEPTCEERGYSCQPDENSHQANRITTGDKGTHHFVDSFDNSEHFFVTDLSIAVYVVELKCPIEFVLHFATAGYTEGADELLEVDSTALVRVKDLEDIICKRIGIAKGEELSVDLLELLLGEGPRGAIFKEPWPRSAANTQVEGMCRSHLCTIAVVLSCQSVWTFVDLLIAAALTWTVCGKSVSCHVPCGWSRGAPGSLLTHS